MPLKDIRQALRALLLSDGGIVALVGERVYPVVLPQGIEDPAIVYSRISAVGGHHMEGPDGLVAVRFQVDAIAPTQDGACVLADLVKDHVDGFSGSVAYGTDSPQAECVIQGVFFESEREDFNPDNKLQRMSRDYQVWYEER